MRKPKADYEFEIQSLPTRLEKGGWRELLNCWEKMITLYARKEPRKKRDVPYWYGERAITGLLAAAAWKLQNGWSLEEFSGHRRQGLKRSPGTGDLWLGTGTSKYSEYTIEAKIVWPRSNWKNAIRQIKDQLGEAEKQLKSFEREYLYGTCIAICYVVPELSEGGKYAKLENINEMFNNIPSELASEKRVVATYRMNQPLEDESRKHKRNYIYPGILIVGELIDCK